MFLNLSCKSKDLANQFKKSLFVFFKKSGYYIYEGHDNFFLHVHKKLKSLNFPLVVAESCTGGALCSALVRNQGASDYFLNGFIVYSNLSKKQLLGVRSSTLSTNGAVSKQTAMEMIRGIFAKTEAQIAIAITGFAGPLAQKKKLSNRTLSSTFSSTLKNAEPSQKPVGLVYIAIGLNKQAYKKAIQKKSPKNLSFIEEGKQSTAFFSEEKGSLLRVEKFLFSGSRTEVQDKSVKSALLLLAQLLF